MTNFRNTRTALVAALLTLLAFAPAAAAITVERGSGGIDPTGDPGGGSGGGGGATEPATTDGVFPVDGPVDYGDGLGAGRNHQGVDLIAKCGKPLVAVHDGRVQTVDYHGSAGNYIVIKSKATKIDHVYMHMVSEARVAEGQRVEAGEVVGRVGTTGNSSTCHLHFEMWSAPGWYQGGSVLNPLPHLKRWQRASR